MTSTEAREKMQKAQRAYIESCVRYSVIKAEERRASIAKAMEEGKEFQVRHRGRTYPLIEIREVVRQTPANVTEASVLQPTVVVEVKGNDGQNRAIEAEVSKITEHIEAPDDHTYYAF